jgi:predicted dehydrogenase
MSVERSFHKDTPMPDDLNLAIIGAGRHGRDLINYCFDIPGVRFKAVCDIWPYAQKYASGILKKRGQPVSVYEDYREMLAKEKDLQAAIIATPDLFHPEQAIACMEAGLHVYLEKEMAITIEAARRVVQTARKTGKLLQVGRQHRSNPRYHAAYDYIHKRKAAGRIGSVLSQWHGHKRVPYTWPESQTIPADTLRRFGYESMNEHRNWRWLEKFSAGEIVNLAAHQIDVFNWFLRATPKGVSASGGLDYYDFFELYDNALCLFEWDFEWEGRTHTVRGAHRTLTSTNVGGFWELFVGDEAAIAISEDRGKGGIRCEPPPVPKVWEPYTEPIAVGHSLETVVMPDGGFRYEQEVENGYVRLKLHLPDPWINASRDVRFFPPIFVPGDDKHPHWYHLANFFDAVRGTAKLTCPAEVGFQACASALKAVEAMKTGRRIELAPQDFVVA